jgi:hypothetical protein
MQTFTWNWCVCVCAYVSLRIRVPLVARIRAWYPGAGGNCSDLNQRCAQKTPLSSESVSSSTNSSSSFSTSTRQENCGYGQQGECVTVSVQQVRKQKVLYDCRTV